MCTSRIFPEANERGRDEVTDQRGSTVTRPSPAATATAAFEAVKQEWRRFPRLASNVSQSAMGVTSRWQRKNSIKTITANLVDVLGRLVDRCVPYETWKSNQLATRRY